MTFDAEQASVKARRSEERGRHDVAAVQGRDLGRAGKRASENAKADRINPPKPHQENPPPILLDARLRDGRVDDRNRRKHQAAPQIRRTELSAS